MTSNTFRCSESFRSICFNSVPCHLCHNVSINQFFYLLCHVWFGNSDVSFSPQPLEVRKSLSVTHTYLIRVVSCRVVSLCIRWCGSHRQRQHLLLSPESRSFRSTDGIQTELETNLTCRPMRSTSTRESRESVCQFSSYSDV